jgi:hypothetical protein
VGERINFPGFTYAPITENAVILLFGMICYSLGFTIETVRPEFPDAVVIDYRDDPKRGMKKDVEFELLSSSFHRHKHPMDGAHIIVCWEHDWKDCPESIEVIELKKKILDFEPEQVKGKEPTTTTPAPKEKPKEKPDYAKSWDARLKWASPESKNLALKLIERLKAELPGTVQRPSFKWYAFFTQEPKTDRNRCDVVMMGKNVVRLAFRVNPARFQPDSLSQTVKGWFFPEGTERRVPVTTENFEAVVKIAKSAYEGLGYVEPEKEPKKQDLKLRNAELINETAARLALRNMGMYPIQVNRYAIGSLAQHFFAPPKLIDAGEIGAITIMADPGSKFEKGKWYDIQVWSDRGALFFFLVKF